MDELVTDRVKKRFFSKVDKTESCWEWTGGIGGGKSGYGNFKFGDRLWLAHRVSWVIHNGPIPDGAKVLHKCDNRLCVNPGHLYLGTLRDNAKDCRDRERGCLYAGPLPAALSVSQKQTIRTAFSRGATRMELARKHGVSFQTIHRSVVDLVSTVTGGICAKPST